MVGGGGSCAPPPPPSPPQPASHPAMHIIQTRPDRSILTASSPDECPSAERGKARENGSGQVQRFAKALTPHVLHGKSRRWEKKKKTREPVRSRACSRPGRAAMGRHWN